MRLALSAVLAVLLLGALGCGIPGASASCPLDKNADGQLTEADFQGMTTAEITDLANQAQTDPISFLPCLPMIEAAQGSIPGLGT